MGFHSSPGGARESNALLLRMRLTGIQAVCTFAKGDLSVIFVSDAQLETQAAIFHGAQKSSNK